MRQGSNNADQPLPTISGAPTMGRFQHLRISVKKFVGTTHRRALYPVPTVEWDYGTRCWNDPFPRAQPRPASRIHQHPAAIRCLSGGQEPRPQLPGVDGILKPPGRSEEHTSELQSLMRISYAVFCS